MNIWFHMSYCSARKFYKTTFIHKVIRQVSQFYQILGRNSTSMKRNLHSAAPDFQVSICGRKGQIPFTGQRESGICIKSGDNREATRYNLLNPLYS